MGQHHHLYNTAAWRNARLSFLTEHPLCRLHGELGKVKQACVVDHIKPHKGDLSLFWDRSNWQALCKQCHDSHKQAQEHTGLMRGAGLTGAPLDLAHPWHAAPGGDQKSTINQPQTAPLPPFAKPRNGQGGLSA